MDPRLREDDKRERHEIFYNLIIIDASVKSPKTVTPAKAGVHKPLK